MRARGPHIPEPSFEFFLYSVGAGIGLILCAVLLESLGGY